MPDDPNKQSRWTYVLQWGGLLALIAAVWAIAELATGQHLVGIFPLYAEGALLAEYIRDGPPAIPELNVATVDILLRHHDGLVIGFAVLQDTNTMKVPGLVDQIYSKVRANYVRGVRHLLLLGVQAGA